MAGETAAAAAGNATPGPADSAPKGDMKAATPPAPRKWEPYDWEDESEKDAEGKPRKYRFETEHDFQQHIRKGNGAERKMREAADERKKAAGERKEWAEFQKAFQQNPRAATRQYAKVLGLTDEQVQQAIQEEEDERRGIEELRQKDPEKLRLLEIARDRDARARELEAKQAEFDERQKQEQFARQTKETETRWRADTEAVQKELADMGPEVAPHMESVIHDIMRVARQNGYALPPKAIAEEARRLVGSFVETHLSRLPAEALGKTMTPYVAKMAPEAIEAMLGDARVLEIARRAAQRMRGGGPTAVKSGTPKPLPPEEKRKHGWDGTRAGYADEPYFPQK